MQVILQAYKKTGSLHHAYLIEGEGTSVHDQLSALIEQDLGIVMQGNPDVWQGKYDTFGIDEGRTLREMQSNRPVSGGLRLFIVTTQFITREAQNALLKVFEEPTEGTHFFIVTPRADALLPTLRSRLFIVARVATDTTGGDASEFSAKKFLAATVVDRIQMIKLIIDEKDKAQTMRVINMLEEEILLQNNTVLVEHKDSLEDLLAIRGYLYGNAPSVKNILEHLAATLPRL
jgi:DNA polymerase III delta prime subunit